MSSMAKKKLSFEVLIILQVIALVLAAVANIGWYRIADVLFILGIIFLTIALGIYVFLYIKKGTVATTLKRNSSSLRNIFVVVLIIAFGIAVVFNIVAIVFLLANTLS